MKKRFLIIGGAGFIGTNFVELCLKKKYIIYNLDSLTYAANKNKLKDFKKKKNFQFKKVDISKTDISKILFTFKPDIIINFAAESHVDQSINYPSKFIKTNVFGTFKVLKASLKYFDSLKKKNLFRYVQVSTDEVYGSLEFNQRSSSEDSPFLPNSPYSASKASADHFVRSYGKTYNLPVIITHSSNNYGPYQNREKLIPKIINNIINLKKIPMYGDGLNVRDWIYVTDNCEAILKIAIKGKIYNSYNIGAKQECNNIYIVNFICNFLNKYHKHKDQNKNFNYKNLIKLVKDRKGHDRRYSVKINKIKSDLNWRPKVKLKSGLRKTIKWYLNHLKIKD